MRTLVALALVLLLPLTAPALEKSRWPDGADVDTLTDAGAAVGPLAKLRVKDKYTVFDFYAEWCGPCRLVDHYLRALLAKRKDIAVRRLNVVDFGSALARELGPDFDALPYLVVFDPQGKRTEVVGFDEEELNSLLNVP